MKLSRTLFLSFGIYAPTTIWAQSENLPNNAVSDLTGSMEATGWVTFSQAVFYIFVLSVLVETALKVFFRWRVWIRFLDARGIKIPIVITVSQIIVWSCNYDPISVMLEAVVKDFKPLGNNYAMVLTGLIVAGGSTAVVEMYKKLRLSDGGKSIEEKRENERDKRRFKLINVTIKEGDKKSPIQVILDDAIVGSIAPGKNAFAKIAGYEISSGKHTLKLSTYDKSAKPLLITVAEAFAVAEGATATFSSTH